MRFTRAAKVAAFPLTALILVALVACQGPAGPSGADGTKGDPGSAGSPGSPGITPITRAVAMADPLILMNHQVGAMTLGTATTPVDVSGHFRGGKDPITYKAAFVVPDPSNPTTAIAFKVSPAMNTTGVFTFSAIKGTDVLTPEDFRDGDKFTITATDADKIPATGGDVTVTIKANRAPTTMPTGGTTIGTLRA